MNGAIESAAGIFLPCPANCCTIRKSEVFPRASNVTDRGKFAPLFEQKWHAGCLALIAYHSGPIGMKRARSATAFPTENNPVETFAASVVVVVMRMLRRGLMHCTMDNFASLATVSVRAATSSLATYPKCAAQVADQAQLPKQWFCRYPPDGSWGA
jgi:hypothetical protein